VSTSQKNVSAASSQPVASAFGEVLRGLVERREAPEARAYADLAGKLGEALETRGETSLPAGDPAAFAGASLAGPPDADRPFVYSDGRLWLRRFFVMEAAVAAWVSGRLAAGRGTAGAAAAGEAADAPEARATRARELLERFGILVVAGGPGTGKTTLAARLLQEHGDGTESGERQAVFTAAPTGKAAARLQESLGPETCSRLRAPVTLHRLLGARRELPGFRHGPGNPLPAGLYLVDEASMLDLELFHQLVSALPAEASLILLGDVAQLPPVGAGTPFAELVEALRRHPAHGPLLQLSVPFRYGGGSPIEGFCNALGTGDARAAFELIDGPDEAVSALFTDTDAQAPPRLLAAAEPWLERLAGSAGAEDALAITAQCRILTALRNGPHGADWLNRALFGRLRQLRGAPDAELWVPVTVTRNQPDLNLANGDTGVVLYRGEQPLAGWFPGSPQAGPLRRFSQSRLPPHELALASTVHRAQGSEYSRVFIMLGPEGHPLLTRALLFTAASRAREALRLTGTRLALREALARTQTLRGSIHRLVGPR